MAEDSGASEPSTRESILNAAHALFTEQGYHGTSMRQIAEQAGVALGGIYNHFESKEEIFTTALVDFHPAHDVIPAILQGAGGDAEDFVRHAARTISENLQHRPDFLNLMFIELIEFRSQHLPLLYDKIFPRGLETARTLTTGMPGIRDLPLDVMLRAFLGLMFSLFIARLMLGARIGGEQEVEQYIDIFLHGVLEEGAS